MKKHFSQMKAFVLLAVALFGATSMNAATITVSSAAESAGVNYNTIQAAYDYVKGLGTISEAYTIEIQSTYAGETAYPISLTAIAGASATNTITIKPAAGQNIVIGNPDKTTVVTTVNTTASNTLTVPDASKITTGMTICGGASAMAFLTVTGVSGNDVTFSANLSALTTPTLFIGTAGTQTIVLDGAQYVNIDGVARTGATTLSIQNPNNVAAQTILFKGGASNNKVSNCIIKGANMTGKSTTDFNTGNICFDGATNGNTIEYNDICDTGTDYKPSTAVLLNNTTASAAEYNTIQNNNIYNSFCTNKSAYATAAVISIAGVTTNARILNNNIYWVAATGTAVAKDYSVIFQNASTTAAESRIEGNIIGGNGTVDGIAMFTTPNTFFGINVCSNSTVKNNTVKNMNVTFSTAKNCIGINIIDVTAGLTDVNAFNGNTVYGITSTCNTAYSLFGICFTPSATAGVTKVRNIANNTVHDLLSLGTAGGPNLRGITCNNFVATALYSFTGNKIYNLSTGGTATTATTVASLIMGLDAVANANYIEKNQIYNFNVNSTSASSYIYGIRVTGGNATGTIIKNNVIVLGVGMTTNLPIYGILQNNATATDNQFFVYNNSVYIGGESSATTGNKSTFAFANFTTNLPAVLDVRNNIFANQRVIKSTEFHYAIGCKAANTITTFTKNLYQYRTNVAGIGLTASGTGTVTTSYASVSAWSTARTTATATADESIDNLAPGFVDVTTATPDLHISSSSSPANQSGVALASVTDDFSGLVRADYTPNDMGAYVIAGSTAVEAPTTAGLSVYAVNKALVFDNLSGQTARIYTANGQLIKVLELTSNHVAVPSTVGFYIVKAGTQNIKLLVK